MLSRFHPIPGRYGRTDRRTDRIAISISRISVLTHDKKPVIQTQASNSPFHHDMQIFYYFTVILLHVCCSETPIYFIFMNTNLFVNCFNYTFDLYCSMQCVIKVIKTRTNRQPICNFLLVVGHIFYRFTDTVTKNPQISVLPTPV